MYRVKRLRTGGFAVVSETTRQVVFYSSYESDCAALVEELSKARAQGATAV